ncbi:MULTISPECIES: protoglobin domain-containing protein [Pseudomonas]|uniref:Globin-coupled histidine kinase n=1 Tax=Pseudomonas nitroreducens TaxID=46680 RepID=A0A6G6ISH2_PSENT|nr:MULTISPECIES: protoglobin domain-containing protein [Pseudomonas]MBG6287430.1 Globin-coupled histidine kinase [Pseudomonas nitroreducens]MCJ1882091.1 protoglobin domain-containing protein [Pseudomonas nitroreducens]MCJ1894628.1 protoglobin domain-containing protein [Pseudomonas nitroreducens]MDG9854277.1 protoglobin domain-containing protein [Pseudomonas nitroreducens]MDH1073522.1 protoglobin domain-containing protein [Pseudomonas nitroreducens]
MSEDRKSWETKNEFIVKELLQLIDISPEECAVLASLQPQAKAAAEQLVVDFYDRLLKHEATREFITDSKRLGTTLAAWFTELFGGQYDDAYALKRLNIGMVHVRIGLPVRYPLAMLDVIALHGEKVAASKGPGAIAAFRKILALDVATFNQSYESNQLSHLAELTGSERLARRLLAGM